MLKDIWVTISVCREVIRPSAGAPISRISKLTDVGEIEYQVYRPSDHEPLGTLVFVHGMNKYGPDDEQIVTTCQAFVKAGFIVVVPKIPLFMQHDVSVAYNTNFVMQSIKAVIKDKALCPSGTVGVFAVSLAAVISLYASTKDDINQSISAMCLMAMPYEPEVLIGESVLDPNAHEFAKYTSLKALYTLRGDTPQFILDGIEARLQDTYDDVERNQLQIYLNKLNDEQRKKVEDILDMSDREKNTQLYTDDLQKLCQVCHEQIDLTKLKAKILLVHSRDDDMISIEESKKLYKALVEHKVDARLLDTDLLGGHAELAFQLKKIIEIIRAIYQFSFFIGSI